MKRILLSLVTLMAGLNLFAQSQQDNVVVGLFPNGANGSNAATAARIEIALKPLNGTYTAVPAATDFIVILKAPKTHFAETDVMNIAQVNPAMFGANTMTFLGATDIGPDDPDNLYFSFSISSGGSLNLSSMTLNNWSYAFTVSFLPDKTQTAFSKLKIVDEVNNAELTAAFGTPVFSNLQMVNAVLENQLIANAFSAFTAMPVNFINFSGFKNGSKNVLNWTTGSEFNSDRFEVQRSADGNTYMSIGTVNTKAINGNSSTELNYTFDDNNPLAAKKSYYRIRQVDIDSRSALTNIVIISADKPKTTEITGVFPNPANDLLNVIVNTPQRANVTLAVTDMNGKVVSQKIINIETGSNTVPVEISQLAKGNYLVKVINGQANTESPVSKFVKH